MRTATTTRPLCTWGARRRWRPPTGRRAWSAAGPCSSSGTCSPTCSATSWMSRPSCCGFVRTAACSAAWTADAYRAAAHLTDMLQCPYALAPATSVPTADPHCFC